MFAVMIRFAAVVFLPPATYRVASPWLGAVARAVAPACLVAISWGPAIQRLHASADIAGDTDAVLQRTVSSPALGDEYNEFSLRWYPLMDVAFNFVHPVRRVAWQGRLREHRREQHCFRTCRDIANRILRCTRKTLQARFVEPQHC